MMAVPVNQAPFTFRADPALLVLFLEFCWYQYDKNRCYSNTQGWNYILHFGVNIMYPIVNECPVSCARLSTDSYDASMCKDTTIVLTIFHDVQDINEYHNLDVQLLDAVTPALVFHSMTPKVDVENNLLMTLDSGGTDSPGILQNDRDSMANIFCAPKGAAMAAYASLSLYER